MKNARDPPSKRSRMEYEMNKALISVFIFALAVDFIGGLICGIWSKSDGFDHW